MFFYFSKLVHGICYKKVLQMLSPSMVNNLSNLQTLKSLNMSMEVQIIYLGMFLNLTKITNAKSNITKQHFLSFLLSVCANKPLSVTALCTARQQSHTQLTHDVLIETNATCSSQLEIRHSLCTVWLDETYCVCMNSSTNLHVVGKNLCSFNR